MTTADDLLRALADMLPTGQTLGEHLAENPDQLTTSGRLMLPGGD